MTSGVSGGGIHWMDMLAKLVLDRDFGVQEKAHGHRNWQWILEGSSTTRGSNSRRS